MQWVPKLVIGLTLLTAPFGGTAQQSASPKSAIPEGETALSSEEQAESYNIYSTVLKVKEPAVADWTIVRETRAFQMCLEPAGDQKSIYQPMIGDYAVKNKNTTVLERKFTLSAYTLVDPEAWKGNAQNRTFAVLSAVGFNPDRTRALLCFWANSSGTCHFVVKQEGKWLVDRSWRGSACGWAY